MWISMAMGLRNLRRRLGRTISTITMLVVGTTLIVFSIGMNEGPYDDMIKMGTGMWNGHVQVLHQEYQDSPSLFKQVKAPDALIASLEKTPGVHAVTSRVEVAGLLSVGKRTAGVQMVGVDPVREPRVSTLPNTLNEGDFLKQPKDPEAFPIVLGKGLAKRLRAKIGDEVVFMGQAADGSMAAEIFVLSGIVETKLDTLDASLAWIRLKDAQTLLQMGQSVHRVVIKLDDVYRADAFAAKYGVLAKSPEKMMAWTTLLPGLWVSIQSDRQGGLVFVFLIVIVVALGIVNTLLMSVFERTKEIGVMKALGASRWHIISTVLWESFWLAFIGVFIGVLLGTMINFYLGEVGVKFFEEPVEFGGMKLSVVYPRNTFRGTVLFPMIIFFSTLIGGIWPAIRGSSLRASDALRHH